MIRLRWAKDCSKFEYTALTVFTANETPFSIKIKPEKLRPKNIIIKCNLIVINNVLFITIKLLFITVGRGGYPGITRLFGVRFLGEGG